MPDPKLLYYVPVVLVIRATDQVGAMSEADAILSAITDLKPEDLEGYSFPSDTEAAPASPNWFDLETEIQRGDDNKLTVREVTDGTN